MLMTSNAYNSRSSEVGIFNPIAIFSASGLVMSMALIVLCGVQIVYPWC